MNQPDRAEQRADHLNKAASYEKKAAERLRPKHHDYEGGATKRSIRAAEAQVFATLALSHRTAVQAEMLTEHLPGRVV